MYVNTVIITDPIIIPWESSPDPVCIDLCREEDIHYQININLIDR